MHKALRTHYCNLNYSMYFIPPLLMPIVSIYCTHSCEVGLCLKRDIPTLTRQSQGTPWTGIHSIAFTNKNFRDVASIYMNFGLNTHKEPAKTQGKHLSYIWLPCGKDINQVIMLKDFHLFSLLDLSLNTKVQGEMWPFKSAEQQF